MDRKTKNKAVTPAPSNIKKISSKVTSLFTFSVGLSVIVVGLSMLFITPLLASGSEMPENKN